MFLWPWIIVILPVHVDLRFIEKVTCRQNCSGYRQSPSHFLIFALGSDYSILSSFGKFVRCDCGPCILMLISLVNIAAVYMVSLPYMYKLNSNNLAPYKVRYDLICDKSAIKS